MEKKTVLTSEGLEKLQAELTQLTTVTRKEIAEKLKVARGYGDLSENSEYDEAKNEQARIEARILELETVIAKAHVVDRKSIAADSVGVGSHVRVKDLEFDEELELYIVGASESDPENNRISDESPIGKALLGARKGQTVEAETPDGPAKFKLLAILED